MDSAGRNICLGEWIRPASAPVPPAGGVWGGMRAGFGVGVFAVEFRASETNASPLKNAIFQKTDLVFSTQCVKNYASQNRKESE